MATTVPAKTSSDVIYYNKNDVYENLININYGDFINCTFTTGIKNDQYVETYKQKDYIVNENYDDYYDKSSDTIYFTEFFS